MQPPINHPLSRFLLTNSSNSWGYVVSTGHYGHSLRFFNEIADVIRADFPDATFDQEAFDVFQVVKSSRIEGMWGLMFKLPNTSANPSYQLVKELPFYIR